MIEMTYLDSAKLKTACGLDFSAEQIHDLTVAAHVYKVLRLAAQDKPGSADVRAELHRLAKAAETVAASLRALFTLPERPLGPPARDHAAKAIAARSSFPVLGPLAAMGHAKGLATGWLDPAALTGQLDELAQRAAVQASTKGSPGPRKDVELDRLICACHAVYRGAGGRGVGCSCGTGLAGPHESGSYSGQFYLLMRGILDQSGQSYAHEGLGRRIAASPHLEVN